MLSLSCPSYHLQFKQYATWTCAQQVRLVFKSNIEKFHLSVICHLLEDDDENVTHHAGLPLEDGIYPWKALLVTRDPSRENHLVDQA